MQDHLNCQNKSFCRCFMTINIDHLEKNNYYATLILAFEVPTKNCPLFLDLWITVHTMV